MAEYYPLLARAIAALPNATPETRRNVYERARQALIAQLRKIEPPVPESDIERESRALDDAVARLEAELNAKAKADVAGKPAPSRANPTSPAAPPVAAAQREPGRGPFVPPPVRGPEAQAPTRAAVVAERRSPAEAASVRKAVDEGSAPPGKADWRSFGRPRDDRPTEEVPAGGSSPDVAKSGPGRNEAVRPPAPQPKPPRSGSARHWIVGSVVAVVVIAIAGLALKLRDNPEELIHPPAAPPAEATSQPSGKIVDRVGAAGTPSAPAAPAPSSTAVSAVAGASQSPQPDNVLPVAQRAALLVQGSDQSQPPSTYVGTVVWRRENINRGQDQPLTEAVRADIDLPQAKLKATMLLQKNTDATLPASHTIELRFTPAADSPIASIKQIDVPQMRKEDSPTGDPLAGVPAPITPNYFLIGLTQGDAAVTRNTDLIKSRQWFDIPLLLGDNKIAKITFEKGDAGDRAVNDAFTDWQQQPAASP
jgi:hypothetical protein